MSRTSADNAFTGKSSNAMGDETTYAGATSMFRRPYSKGVAESDLIFCGVPYDLAVTNRPGTRFGPRAIRTSSAQLSWSGGSWPFTVDPFEHLMATDYGDCEMDFGFPDKIPDEITAHTRHLLSGDGIIVTMGGDHFITYPILKAFYEKYGPLSLVHFDAHSDTWREDEERIHHGTMFFHAARHGLVVPERSVQIGLRTGNSETHGFNIMDANFVHQYGVSKVIENALEIVGDRPAYLTFDIDCLDPAFAPGTGTPVCGGLSTYQAQTLVRGLTGIDFKGMDLVEVAPAYDVGEITSLAGASIIMNFISLIAEQKKCAG